MLVGCAFTVALILSEPKKIYFGRLCIAVSYRGLSNTKEKHFKHKCATTYCGSLPPTATISADTHTYSFCCISNTPLALLTVYTTM